MNRTNTNPKVSVLLPVYNGSNYVNEAIASILNQSFTNFEFIIINDGSTDNSLEIINSFDDSRIRLINNSINSGIVKSLNTGLDQAVGKYILRMDADDISLPKRIEKQVNFMDKNPGIGISGTQVLILEGLKKKIKSNPFINPEDIKANLLYKSSLAHPTVIMRKSLLDKHNLRYSEDYPYAEDYELWFRATQKFKITNMNQALLAYRKHDHRSSSMYSKEQMNSSKKIVKQALQLLQIAPSPDELELHFSLSKPDRMNLKEFILFHREWSKKLIAQNKKVNWYNAHSLKKVISNRWYTICRLNKLGALHFLSSQSFNISNRRDFKNLLKCLLK